MLHFLFYALLATIQCNYAKFSTINNASPYSYVGNYLADHGCATLRGNHLITPNREEFILKETSQEIKWTVSGHHSNQT